MDTTGREDAEGQFDRPSREDEQPIANSFEAQHEKEKPKGKKDSSRYWISLSVEIVLASGNLVLAFVEVRTASDSHMLAIATIRADSLMEIPLRRNEEAERINQENVITENRAYLYVKAVESPGTVNDSSIEVALANKNNGEIPSLNCQGWGGIIAIDKAADVDFHRLNSI